jgi:3-oxoacyl-[acyl-carrier protein] reductase
VDNAEWAGRTALVTGGGRGIGRAVSLRLAREGARVAVGYISGEQAAREVQDEITAAGGQCEVFQADVADAGAVQAMVGEVEGALGPVDLLVPSAGVVAYDEGEGDPVGVWRRVMAVNVDGTYFTVRAVMGGMVERGYGRIVCMSSVAALDPSANLAAYSASKAAIIALVKSWAKSLAPHVRVNALAPGFIETDMVADITGADRQAVIDDTPLRRFGTADEMAELTYFLLSDRSSFTTGETYGASGGWVMAS